MDWWLVLLLIIGSLIVLMMTGLPTAFCFMLINIVGVYLLWGGETGLLQLIFNIKASITKFSLMPLILFVLMGSVMFHSGVAPHMIEAINKWLGRLPGRLSFLAVAAGTLFSTLSGSSMGSTAMLGSVLVPEMEKYGYKKPMSLGPILGSGGLAIMIPPSSLGVFISVIAEISVGRLLIAIIVPGLLMATFYATYILLRCQLQPSLAPPYDVSRYSLSNKISSTIKYVLPLGFIVFLVTGLIFLGVATPSEAAAAGAIGTFILAAAYGRLKWGVVQKAVRATLRTVCMVLIIMASATAFSQVLAFSGATKGMVLFVLGLPLAPIVVIIGMHIIMLAMGTFMDVTGIIMITIPMFMPVVNALGFDPIWFVATVLLNIEMAQTSPPFGLTLFVMKGVSPPDTTMGDVYKAGLPFLGCDLVALTLMIAFPAIALWLPSMMR